MKPWKIVILCSVSMFVGSMYQGCAVGDAGAGSKGPRTVIGPIEDQNLGTIDNQYYDCARTRSLRLISGSGDPEVSYDSIPENYTAYCCPDGFSYAGHAGDNVGVYCLEDL